MPEGLRQGSLVQRHTRNISGREFVPFKFYISLRYLDIFRNLVIPSLDLVVNVGLVQLCQ